MKRKSANKGIALLLSALFLISWPAEVVKADELQIPTERAVALTINNIPDASESIDSSSDDTSSPVIDSSFNKSEDNSISSDGNAEDITPPVSESENDIISNEDSFDQEILESNIEISSDSAEQEETFSALEAVSESMKITDIYKNEKIFQISMNQFKMPANGKELVAAVWSQEKGQDDLRWYSLNKTTDGYGVQVDISNHKTAGIYHVHMYLRRTDGSMQFLYMDTFQVTDTSLGSVEIIQKESDLSKASLILHDVIAPSGVNSISVPVWSRSDQKDIVWYQAERNGDNTWKVDLSYSRHVNSTGNQFLVHIYGSTGNGIVSRIGETRVTMERGKPSVTVTPTARGMQVSLENCSVTASKEVRFAVWSANNGQDDLKWYFVTNEVNGKYVAGLPFFKESGEYYIHCYAKDSSGKLILQNTASYTPEVPTAGSIIASIQDSANGRFELTIKDISHPEMIKEISVPVWSAPNQSDIVWYKAVKQADGTWQVKGNIYNHKGNAGRYYAHVYIKDLADNTRFACNTEFQMAAVPMKVDAVFDTDFSNILLSASNVVNPDGVKDVRFAVWTKENGQDDIRWYITGIENGIYQTVAKVADHRGQGPLIIHAYARSNKDQMVFLKAFELPLNNSVTASIRFEDFSEQLFSSDMYIDLSNYTLGIKSVDVAVWSAPDQSDIFWYHADPSSENTWHAAFSPLKHKGYTGNFNAHVYVTFVNGIRVYAGSSKYSISVQNKKYILQNADGTVTAVLYSDQPLTTPRIAVWSQENGQDDLVWYPLTYNGKCYTAAISIRNHKHNGMYHGHFYGNNSFQGAVNFTFPETITVTETVSKTPAAGYSDTKFFNRKLLCSVDGHSLVLRNTDGSIFRYYPELHGVWIDTLESERLILYANTQKEIGLARIDSNFNVEWNRILFTMPNLAIDPCIVKNGSEYLITATEIQGTVNNSDPDAENGTYTIHTWKSSDLLNWTESANVATENHNLEEIKMVQKDGILYMAYEKEVVDKGKSSILGRISYDNGMSWSDPIELLPADSDHEICNLSVNGDRFVLFYSSDKDSPGSSYMGAKAYYAIFDKNLRCISKDIEIKTGATGGILMYDVTWIDSTHYILYSENYLTTGTLVVEKAR